MFSLTWRRLCTVMAVAVALTVVPFVPMPSAEAAQTKLNLVVMGDSYSSGLGAGSYSGGDCRRSPGTYAKLLADRISAHHGYKVDYRNIACSGAVANDLAVQTSSLTSFERNAVDMILLTIGGNDGGFSQVVSGCFVPLLKGYQDCKTAVEKANADLQKIRDSIVANLDKVAVAMPDAKIVLMGYPYPVDLGAEKCFPQLNSLTSTGVFHPVSEVRSLAALLEVMQIQAINTLNGRYPGRFQFVSIEDYFAGHENCGSKAQWLRGTFDGIIPAEWWHPNLNGYEAQANYLFHGGVYRGTEDTFLYRNLPFACGFTAHIASTYDTLNLNGTVYRHGKAIDFPLPSGTKVVAPVAGTASVRYDSALGNYVDINGSDGKVHRLAHLQSSGLIANGTKVNQGQQIGLVGSTGATTGPHLHYVQLVGGNEVEVQMGGPRLEWSEPYTAGGDRITSHTLESGNCGSSTGSGGTGTTSPSGSDARHEMLFYNRSTGRWVINDIDGNGQHLQIADGTSWSKGWDIIVPLDIDGDGVSELLFYTKDGKESGKGRMLLYRTSANGLGSLLRESAWSNFWTHIVPIDLDGDKRDELIVYSAGSGKYYIFDVTTTGQLIELRTGTWTTGWQVITALEIGGARGQELLFYKSGSPRGHAILYSTNDTGPGTELGRFEWSSGWTHIVPTDIDGDGTDELIFYNATTGNRIYNDVASNGGQKELSRSSWSSGWQFVISFQADNDKPHELLFYNSNRSTNRGLQYNNSLSGLTSRIEHNWSSGWTHILPVQLPSR